MIKIDYPKILDKIFDKLLNYNATPIIIGGYIRDTILNIYSKDIDIEVYGLKSFHELENILQEFGTINTVGKSFGVCKLHLKNLELDFTLPRTDSKIATGHRGFEISLKPHLDFVSATRRRDFTINAIGYDVQNQKIIDPFNGMNDLKNKILKAVDKNTFTEDPLRVLRAVQFCARFDLTMDVELFTMCQNMIQENLLESLSKERIFEEIKKLLLKASKPSIGFELLRTLGALTYFPELKAIIGIQQNPLYHPEGDVWAHTMLALDVMANQRTTNDKTNIVLMLAVLCHDFGKATTTEQVAGIITSVSHEIIGLKYAESFITKLSNEKDLLKRILPLIEYHLAITQYYEQEVKDSALMRLATKVNIGELLLVSRADYLGRKTKESLEKIYKAGDVIEKRAKNLKILNGRIPPILKGKDILACGKSPSKEFTFILEKAYEAQMDGIFNSHIQAIEWLKEYLIS